MKKLLYLASLVVCLFVIGYRGWNHVVFSQSGNEYELAWSTTSGGGQTIGGGEYLLGGTVGQVSVSQLSDGDYTLVAGFWSGVDSPGSPIVWSNVFLPFAVKP